MANEPPGIDIILKYGASIRLRPTHADDESRIVQGFDQLSPLSRRLRFFTPIKELSKDTLESLTHADQINHVVWIAVDPNRAGHPAIGLGRYVRMPDDPGLADAAFVVADAWQNRGVGSWLLGAIYACAQVSGVQKLQAEVLPENARVLKWLRNLGATGRFEDGVNRLFLPVSKTGSAEDTSEIRKFRGMVAMLVSRLPPTGGR